MNKGKRRRKIDKGKTAKEKDTREEQWEDYKREEPQDTRIRFRGCRMFSFIL